MKRALPLLAACLALLLPSAAFPQGDTAVDFSGHIAASPIDPYGETFGYGLGVVTDIRNFGVPVSGDLPIRLRVSVTNNDWHHDDTSGIPICYRRIVFFAGARAFTPLAPSLVVYGELGPQVSFDARERVTFVGGTPVKTSHTPTRFGLQSSAGVDYVLSDRVTVGVNLTAHLVTDSYYTAGIRLGYRTGR